MSTEARIVVPFTDVHPLTRKALEPYGDRVEYLAVHKLGAYWELFSSLWRAGEPFILVEHDIAVNPETIAEFDACEHGWCSAPYWWYGQPGHPEEVNGPPQLLETSVGCVRFDAEFIRTDSMLADVHLRDLRRRLPELLPPEPLPHWFVDYIVGGRLEGELKLRPHLHAEVAHHQRLGRPLRSVMRASSRQAKRARKRVAR